MTDDELRERVRMERRFRALVLDLELTSCGVTSPARLTVAAVAPRPGERVPSSTKAFASAPPTTGDWTPPHIAFWRRWRQARTDARRLEILAEMETELDGLQHAPPPVRGESVEDRDRRLIDDYEGFPAKDVAIAMRMSETEVRKVRTSSGRGPELGELTIAHKLGPDASPAERAKHAAYLNETYGLGPRQIAPLLGVNYRQVCRYLKTTRSAA